MQKLREIDFKKEGIQLLKDYALIVLGTLITGMAFGWCFLPYDIAPGGVTGISTVLAQYLPLSVGTLSVMINIPLFLVSWRSVGWRFAVRSFAAMLLINVFSWNFSSISLMLIAGAVSLALFAAKGASDQKGGAKK